MNYNMFYKGEYIGYISDKEVFLEAEGVIFVERKEPPSQLSVIVTGIEESLSWEMLNTDDVILEEGKGSIDFDYGRVYEYKGCTYVLEDYDHSWGFTRFDLIKIDKTTTTQMIPEVQND
ncbi:hypothetical protein CHOTACABRAS_148 [Bacillus phage Chotacabras]|nr:hypothetical protein CHOTACABRAS_148 [Bacillus phage Chotacabras]